MLGVFQRTMVSLGAIAMLTGLASALTRASDTATNGVTVVPASSYSAPLEKSTASRSASASLASTSYAAPSGSVVATHGQLRVSGTHIVDKNGAPTGLRGTSLFWSQWMPQYYNRATIDTLVKDWKIDVVRAAVGVDDGTGRDIGGVLQNYTAERDRAFTVIDAAIANGVYVIVDWHAHSPYPDQAIRFFQDVANKYKDAPNIIYEDWNEPLPRYGWSSDIKPYHAKVIEAIRRIDSDGLVVAGTGTYSQDVDVAANDPLPYANVAYTLHYYANETGHQQPLFNKAQTAASKVALFVTEQGFTNADGNGPVNADWSQKWWDFLDNNHIGHLNWSISDKQEGSAALKPGAAPDNPNGSPEGGFEYNERTESGSKVFYYLQYWNHRNT